MLSNGSYQFTERGCSNVVLDPEESERIDLVPIGGSGTIEEVMYTGGRFYCGIDNCNENVPSGK